MKLEWLTYNQDANRLYFDLLKEHHLLPEEKTGGLFSHICIAEHIWFSRILDKKSTYKVWELLGEKQLSALFVTLLEILGKIIDAGIEKQICYLNFKGEQFHSSVEDVLLHIVNHASYHRGQISETLKTLNIQPPATDYIFYRRSGK